MIGLRTIVIKH